MDIVSNIISALKVIFIIVILALIGTFIFSFSIINEQTCNNPDSNIPGSIRGLVCGFFNTNDINYSYFNYSYQEVNISPP